MLIKTFQKIDKMVIKNTVAVKIAFGENPKSLRRKTSSDKNGN